MLSWYHLHSSMPRGIDLRRTAVSTRSYHGEPPAQFYSRLTRFLLAASGFFSRGAHTDFSATVRSLHAAVPVTRPFTAFRYAIVAYAYIWFYDDPIWANKKALYPCGKDKERCLLLWYHLHSLMPHSINLSGYRSSSRTSTNVPDYGGIRRSSTLASRDFFSQLRVLFRSLCTMGFPPAAHSLEATGTVTRPFKAFALINFSTAKDIPCFDLFCQALLISPGKDVYNNRWPSVR